MTCTLCHHQMIDSQTSRCTVCGDEIHNELRDRPCTRDPKKGCRFGACCLDEEKPDGRPDPAEWVDVGKVEMRDKDGAKVIKPRLVRVEHVRPDDTVREVRK